MSGILKVVATPIGNVGDMSERGITALKEADLVLAEDTRHTRQLFDRLCIQTPLLSCHQHNEEARVPEITQRLLAGENICLVTDAGAPGISDPGARVIDAASALGIKVEVFPGASAVIAALMGAGLHTSHFVFLGFLPKRNGPRAKLLRTVPKDLSLVLFASPKRVKAVLTQLHKSLGRRRVVVARELTKQFETFHRGVLGDELNPPVREQGEMVIVIEGEGRAAMSDDSADEAVMTLADHAHALQSLDLKPKARAKALASAAEVSVADAYAFLEAQKNELPKSAMEKLRSQQRIELARSKNAREDLRAALHDAVNAFLSAEGHAGISSERPADAPEGSPELQEWLSGSSTLPAPTELREMAMALLGALSAEEALDDALMMNHEEA